MNLRFAALLLAILLFLAGCGPKEDINEPEITTYEEEPALTRYEDIIQSAPKVDVPSDFYHISFPPNDQGLYEVVIPVNLLGGNKAERVVEDFEKAGQIGPENLYSDIRANPDGTVTYVFSEYQLLSCKYLMFANPHRETESIVETEYEDSQRLTSVVVTVNKKKYLDAGLQRIWANLYFAMYTGMYQILCGVPPEEWHTVITVKDSETGELISQWEFPFDNMYKTFNWLAPQTPLTDSGGEGSAGETSEDKEANE